MKTLRKMREVRRGRAEMPPALTSVPAWRQWPPEQLWLWPDPTQPAVRARIGEALANAVSALPARDIEFIAEHAERSDPGAALRLTARLLCASGDQCSRDLASCALLLALLEHRDERAAIEMLVLLGLSAMRAADTWSDKECYPPPLDRPRQLHVRLTQRGRLAVAVLAQSTASWARSVTDLGRLAAGDPLSDVGTNGRQSASWEGQ